MSQSQTIINTIQFKRGKKATLDSRLIASDLGIPKVGEPVYETDTKRFKIGDGVNAYKDLPYFSDDTYSKQIVFKNYFDLPSVGEQDILYIIKDERNCYIFENGHYSLVSAGKEINAGGALADYDNIF